VDDGLIALAPKVKMLKEGPPRKGFPTDEEVDAIVALLPDRLRAPMRFLAVSGWRVREALNLEWRSVDLKEGMIRLEADETKGGEVRTFPFSEVPELVDIIQAQRATADAIEAQRRARGDITPVTHVFCKPDGSPNRVYQHAWGSACRDAGYPDRLVHDLRRYAARNLIRAGVTEKVAMELLGHRTASVFRRYNVTDERDQRLAVRRLVDAQAERRATRQANA
jgi:integrase